MAFERKNHTQSMATEAAQQAFERLTRDLRVPKSAVLQTILEAVPTADLVALVRGDLALHTAKIVALEHEESLAIRSEIESSLALLGARIAEASRLGAQRAVAEHVKSLFNVEGA
ncbi:hypothetical protein [Stutzerimonas nitrititolerans]|uniref:hypothetical protein n=1 Tax=Stutzerimonas nitrititolerans TaxID=2482751 RepID=UPI00289D4F08|nr:hypothetical protein [Stutzerimonas nitrititolerans]